MNILVVDDHVLIREALRAVLNGLRPHATVLEASNGHQAMQIAEEVPDLDLILLDLNLPDRDGFSLRRKIETKSNGLWISAFSDSFRRRPSARSCLPRFSWYSREAFISLQKSSLTNNHRPKHRRLSNHPLIQLAS